MTADLRVIGIDPGPTPGLVLLDYTRWDDGTWACGAEALQCTAGLLPVLLPELLTGNSAGGTAGRVLVQVERFITGNRTSRSLQPKAGQITREMVTTVELIAEQYGVKCYVRRAADVKPWAEANGDARLAAAGLLEPTKGLRHAKDAGKHALFCAVADGGVPDPLSRKHAR